MGAGRITIRDLDYYVSECDALGGPQSARAAEFLSDFYLDLGPLNATDLDPFSDEYFTLQIGVYEQISGRRLDQESGEQFSFNVADHIGKPNPYNSHDISQIACHMRAISAALSIANLPAAPRMLDFGSGWGMSSEIMAYLGATVTAVDINPNFVTLINQRAKQSGLPIVAKLSGFDEYQDEQTYDAAVFYECLHHSLKVWETLRHIKKFLKPNGKIIFAGEPVTNYFWKDWGVRTDSLSVYCIRKFGWFESGWSAAFLHKAFNRAGLDLHLYPYAGMQNTDIGIAVQTNAEALANTPEAAFPFAHVSQMEHALRTTQKMHHELSKKHHELVNRLQNSPTARTQRAVRSLARSIGLK